MERLPVGTKEYLVIDVTDRLNNLTTLDGTTLTFDVIHEDGATHKYTAEPATNDGMKIKCLVDTDGWEPDHYDLFVDILAAPEQPRLGPFAFRVE